MANTFKKIIKKHKKKKLQAERNRKAKARERAEEEYADDYERRLSRHKRSVMDNETARIFANKLEDMTEFLIPKYAQEGKTSLVIAIGCTGGKHRSVTIARELYSIIARNGEYGFRLEHRDVDKDRLLKK